MFYIFIACLHQFFTIQVLKTVTQTVITLVMSLRQFPHDVEELRKFYS